MRNRRINGALAAVAVSSALLTACGSANPDSADAEASLSDGEDILIVGTSVGAPPYEFYDKGSTSEVLGYEPDLLNAAADVMGIDIEFQVADYSALFGALDAGRYDFVAFGLVDRISRQQQYDVLDYAKDAHGFLGKTGTTDGLKSMTDVCGKSVAVQAGASVVPTLEDESTKCQKAGHPPIQLLESKDLPAIALAVSTGRADYASSQVPLLAFNAAEMDGLEVADLTFLEGLVGFVLPKGSELTGPLGEAIDQLMEDGTYDEIMSKWGLTDLTLDRTSVNAGTAE